MLQRESASPYGVSSGIDTFAHLAAAQGQPFRAAVLSSGTANLIARCGAAPDRVPDAQEAEQRMKEVCGWLDDETLAHAHSLATALTVDELIAFALNHEDHDVEAVAGLAV
jgi:uroporphyrinogen-III synthase